MRSSIAIALSTALGLAAASKECKQLSTGKNVGNPIHEPALNKVVPAGTPFTITWTPTHKSDYVSLVLLRGPSTNILPDGCIVDHIPNTGTYSWTPPATLEPDVTHYGLKIIVDGSGDYQYSNQFGVSNPAYGHSTTTTSLTHTKAKHTKIATGYAPVQTTYKKSHPHHTAVAVVSQLSDGQPIVSTHAAPANATSTHSVVISTLSLNATALTSAPSASLAPAPYKHNTTQVHLTVPASLQASTKSAYQSAATGVSVVNGTIAKPTPTKTPSTSAPLTQPSNGAARMGAAGLVAGLGALAAMVL